MKVNKRALLSSCIEAGIQSGWNRAHKHTDEPSEHVVAEQIENAIWYEIDQYFDFERNLTNEINEGLDALVSLRK